MDFVTIDFETAEFRRNIAYLWDDPNKNSAEILQNF
jgi:hypothetical protein